ncbi:acyl-CoA dehydrogenase family protein [Streptomyces alboniger]|uniref:acyl-CoA dehydrogenase family protein n=1 Tax=Streptomyces alboniger TaxID=132473 RepID=UPI001FE73211|nr:acyl-CoA dehydrogenase family protein [Streptomyces alboniger]
MTAFSLDPEQTAWCAELRTLASERLRPLAEKGEPGRVNRPLVEALGELGLLGRLFDDAPAVDSDRGSAPSVRPGRGSAPVVGPGQDPAAAVGSDRGSAPAGRPDRGSAPNVAPGPGQVPAPAVRPGGGSGPAVGPSHGATPARGTGALDLCLMRESLAYACTEAETALALQGLGAYPVHAHGTAAQRERWLPPVRAGRAIVAFALSEPGAGSDAAALSLTATPDGSGSGPGTRSGSQGWRLTGEKCWISNAPEADFYTVFARTSPGTGARGVTAFLVPADRAGLTGTRLDMLSPHPIGALVFDGVRVGPEDVLGEVDRGFRVAMTTLNRFRPSVGAFAVGMAAAALDATLAYTAEREAFGGKLKDLQSVAHQVAEMATRTEAARLMVYAAASAYDREGAGAPGIARRAAMAKLLATENAQYVVDAAVQLHGARALQRGHLLEHLYREVRAPRVYEGASEVQRTIIAKELYG